MSRSFKRAHGKQQVVFCAFTCCESEKKDKQEWNRTVRHIIKRLLKHDEEAYLPDRREVTNVYDGGKDGKQKIRPNSKYYSNAKRK